MSQPHHKAAISNDSASDSELYYAALEAWVMAAEVRQDDLEQSLEVEQEEEVSSRQKRPQSCITLGQEVFIG